MSFNSTAPRSEYTATAAQTVFPFLFKIYADSDLVVYKTVGSADPLLLQLTTDFTVTINGDAGGELTLNSGADADDVITILRDLPITREVEYQTSGDMRAETLNIDQEYQTYLIADQNDQIAALEAGEAGVSSFVQRTGDTMTGQLKGIDPVSAEDFTRKDYVDAIGDDKVDITGDTMTGQLKGITPVDDEDLSRKDYVDGITATKLNASGDAPMFASRAWVNFNGTGTVAIRDSGNISSLTDNGVGLYQINFTTNIEDVNYSALSVGTTSDDDVTTSNDGQSSPYDYAVSSVKIKHCNGAGGKADPIFMNVSIFR